MKSMKRNQRNQNGNIQSLEALKELLKDPNFTKHENVFVEVQKFLEKMVETEQKLRNKCENLETEIQNKDCKIKTESKKELKDRETIMTLKAELEKAQNMAESLKFQQQQSLKNPQNCQSCGIEKRALNEEKLSSLKLDDFYKNKFDLEIKIMAKEKAALENQFKSLKTKYSRLEKEAIEMKSLLNAEKERNVNLTVELENMKKARREDERNLEKYQLQIFELEEEQTKKEKHIDELSTSVKENLKSSKKEKLLKECLRLSKKNELNILHELKNFKMNEETKTNALKLLKNENEMLKSEQSYQKVEYEKMIEKCALLQDELQKYKSLIRGVENERNNYAILLYNSEEQTLKNDASIKSDWQTSEYLEKELFQTKNDLAQAKIESTNFRLKCEEFDKSRKHMAKELYSKDVCIREILHLIEVFAEKNSFGYFLKRNLPSNTETVDRNYYKCVIEKIKKLLDYCKEITSENEYRKRKSKMHRKYQKSEDGGKVMTEINSFTKEQESDLEHKSDKLIVKGKHELQQSKDTETTDRMNENIAKVLQKQERIASNKYCEPSIAEYHAKSMQNYLKMSMKKECTVKHIKHIPREVQEVYIQTSITENKVYHSRSVTENLEFTKTRISSKLNESSKERNTYKPETKRQNATSKSNTMIKRGRIEMHVKGVNINTR